MGATRGTAREEQSQSNDDNQHPAFDLLQLGRIDLAQGIHCKTSSFSSHCPSP
jgi:hypothetical protein